MAESLNVISGAAPLTAKVGPAPTAATAMVLSPTLTDASENTRSLSVPPVVVLFAPV